MSIPQTKKDEIKDLDVHIFASEDINEDLLGTPSPVRVTILQLATAIEFNQMSELSKNSDYKSHLGESVLDKVNITMHPAKQEEFKLPLKEKTEYLGIVVAYRDLSKNWKLALYKQDKKWYQKGGNFLYLNVTDEGVIPLNKKDALTLIAEDKLRQKGKELNDLTEKQKKKMIKELNKVVEDKKAADLKRGIFIEKNAASLNIGE